ncbi:hypothetical protein ERO13_D11G211450v2 [Gossypium hirsutum]|nr:hypothetical protein ERO13_D11G211450v2 [Gossypium hirsutum]
MIPTTQTDCSIPKHLKSKTFQQPIRVLSHQSYQSASIIYWKVFFQKPLRLFKILALFHLKSPKNSFSNYFLPLFQNGEPISNVACTMWLSPIYFNSIKCIDYESRTSNLLRLLHLENPFELLSKPSRSKLSPLLQNGEGMLACKTVFEQRILPMSFLIIIPKQDLLSSLQNLVSKFILTKGF